MLYNADLTKL